jgi:aryl-alcohol dehydrogenase-like predicted oxidoreductase
MRDPGSAPAARIGLGCMALTGIYGPITRETAVGIVRRALDLGVTHFDTAELYGPYLNEELLAEALGPDRANVEIATKFGYRIEGGRIVGLDSRPTSIRAAVEGSLRRLRRDHVDVLYQHRPDPNIPVEDVVGTMSALVDEGKAIDLGLSATDPETLRRASKVHRISFVQNEFSLIERRPEDGLLRYLEDTCAAFVCYSPLGRGILARTPEVGVQRAPSDYRQTDARFEADRMAVISAALAPLWRIASARSVPPASISLAWLLAKSPSIRVIPGATSIDQLMTNVAANQIVLASEEIAELERIVVLREEKSGR